MVLGDKNRKKLKKMQKYLKNHLQNC